MLSYFFFFGLGHETHDYLISVMRSKQEVVNDKGSTPLPVLCIEDGMVILRFSEIFGIHEPIKKREKRDRRYSVPKGVQCIYGLQLSQ